MGKSLHKATSKIPDKCRKVPTGWSSEDYAGKTSQMTGRSKSLYGKELYKL